MAPMAFSGFPGGVQECRGRSEVASGRARVLHAMCTALVASFRPASRFNRRTMLGTDVLQQVGSVLVSSGALGPPRTQKNECVVHLAECGLFRAVSGRAHRTLAPACWAGCAMQPLATANEPVCGVRAGGHCVAGRRWEPMLSAQFRIHIGSGARARDLCR